MAIQNNLISNEQSAWIEISQLAYNKMFNSSYGGNENETYMIYHPTPFRIVIIRKTKDNKF